MPIRRKEQIYGTYLSSLGVHIAVDVNSGAVHVLDELTYDLLSALAERDESGALLDGPCRRSWRPPCPSMTPPHLAEAWAELRELKREGLLFEADDYIDRDKAASMQQQALVKALCLHVSHDCNLRCKYCFAGTGDFGTGSA